MKSKNIIRLIILYLFSFNSFFCKEILNDFISIPTFDKNYRTVYVYENFEIKTKNGIINYTFEPHVFFNNAFDMDGDFHYEDRGDTVILENIKNIDLFPLPENDDGIGYFKEVNKNKITSLKIGIDYKKNSYSQGIFNRLVCDIFYKTNYINKNVYSIWHKNENITYKYFGGVPDDVEKKISFYKKYTLGNNNKISEIYMTTDDDRNWMMKEKLFQFKENEKKLIEFSGDTEGACFPWKILDYIERMFLFRFEKYKNFYLYKQKQEDIPYFEIRIKMDNITIILNKNNLIKPKIYGGLDYYELRNATMITTYFCDHIILGTHFLDNFEFYKYDLETGDIDIYTNNEETIIINNDDKKINLNSSNYIFGIILVFSIFITGSLISFRSYKKQKNLEFYDYYYDV